MIKIQLFAEQSIYQYLAALHTRRASLVACSLSAWLHDGQFLHVNAHEWVWHRCDFLHGYTSREPDSGTIVINGLLKPWSTAPPLFSSPPPDSPPTIPLFPPSRIFPTWWIGFQLLSVNTISRRSCPIVPQQHMCGDTDQRGNRHFRAMGLGCMQHKTSNGGLASDSYWCTMRLYVTGQADKNKQAQECRVVMVCKNGQT